MINQAELAFPFPKYLGNLTFLILGIFAIVFYLERTIILDAAFQLFSMIQHNGFAIQVNRFGAVVTQVFPVLAIKNGLPLDIILKIYSLAFVLYPFLVYTLLTRVIKNRQFGILLLFFCILLTSHTFYWIQSELIQACIFILFFYGLLMKWVDTKVNPLKVGIAYGFIGVIIFFHPLSFIPFAFIWLFFLLGNSHLKTNRFFLSVLGIAIVLLLIKNFVLPISVYDQTGMRLSQNLFDKFWEFPSFRSTRNFRKAWLSFYYLYPILVITIISFYFRTKNFRKLILFLGFNYGYLFLVNSTYRWGPFLLHMESFYQIISIFLIFPLVFDILPVWKYKKYLIYILPVIFMIRLINIYQLHHPYSDRVNYYIQLLESTKKEPGTKYYAFDPAVAMDTLIMSWASPFETLLYSARQEPDSVRTIIIANPETAPVGDFGIHKKAFLTPYGPIQYEKMRKRYFNFSDTTLYQQFFEEGK